MNWRNVAAFYETLCETKNITQLTFHLLILKGVRTYSLRHIHKIKLTVIYG